jgi:hypothetical protein
MSRPALVVMLAASLVELSGPGNQRIWINGAQITNIREPRSETHIAPGTRCLLYTTDGKIITVVEDCNDVRRKLQQEAPP